MSLIYGFSEDDKSENSQIETNKTDIANLTNKVETNKTDIASLTNSQVETNKVDIASLAGGTVGQVKANKTAIADLAGGAVGQPKTNKVDIANLASGAVGQPKTNKVDIANLASKVSVEFKETTGSFVAPLDDGKVEITGWSMSDNNTVVAVILKANSSLTGVIKASGYSCVSLSNSDQLMTSPMQLSDMKLGRAAILFTGRNPSHTKMFANTRGNAVGTIVERTIDVKFVYIDHTDKKIQA